MKPSARAAILWAGSVATIAAIPVAKGWSNRDFRFVASSTIAGYDREGSVLDQGPYGLLFHTATQTRPSVEVDLGALRDVRSIEVINRSDCCSDRAIPLRVEVAGNDRRYVEVGRMAHVFETWAFDLPSPTRARFVRLTAMKRTMLHLHSIRVR